MAEAVKRTSLWHRWPSKVLRCSCAHDFQDKRYGLGRRLMNPTKKENYRCTVCGTETVDK